MYRPNKINVHSALKHENILPEKHGQHSDKFYCFHLMLKMDCELRQILSTKEVGCLKHFYNCCSTHMELDKWDTAYKNVKFILKETLNFLAYLHSNGYVHRDIKGSYIRSYMTLCVLDYFIASNIMIKMRYVLMPTSQLHL